MNRRMNVALVILHADAARGGAERYTLDLAADLLRRGLGVSLLAGTFAAGVPSGAKQVTLAAGGLTRLGRYLRFLEALDAHLSEQPYDVIHAMLPVRQCDVYHPHAGLAAEAIESGHAKHRGPRRAFAKVFNRLNRKRRRFAAVERQLLTGPNPPIVLCLSEYVKAAVRKHYPLPEEKLATLFNGVDLAKFDPALRTSARADTRGRLGILDGVTVALTIAQDFARKGLREAILAANAVNGRDAYVLALVVVGKEDPGRYKALGKPGRILFPGPTDDPYAYYQAADFFVLPTRHDPCSLVVLEALAMGVPVISTKFNGACEIMADGVHGYVLDDPADVPALAEAMAKMLDPGRRKRMRVACLELRQTLSQERHVDELMRAYGRVARSRKEG